MPKALVRASFQNGEESRQGGLVARTGCMFYSPREAKLLQGQA